APGVVDGGADLQPVAHDPRIAEQPLDIRLPIARYCFEVESAKRPAVILALVENRAPAEPGLGAFKDEQLEERKVVVARDAPLLVVVAHHQLRWPGCPRATDRLHSLI